MSQWNVNEKIGEAIWWLNQIMWQINELLL